MNRGDRLHYDEERPASSGRQRVPADCRHSAAAVAQEGPTRRRHWVGRQLPDYGRPGYGSTPCRATQPKYGLRQHFCRRRRGKLKPPSVKFCLGCVRKFLTFLRNSESRSCRAADSASHANAAGCRWWRPPHPCCVIRKLVRLAVRTQINSARFSPVIDTRPR